MKKGWKILVTKDFYKQTNSAQVETILKKVLQLSRHEIARLKFQNGLFCDGKQVYIHDHLKVGDTLSITLYDQAQELLPNKEPLEILYEDEDVIVVWKRAGIPVHPTKGHPSDSLGNMVQAYFLSKGEQYTIHAIGRLDLPVCGIMVFAKNRPSATRLHQQNIHKTYQALVHGRLENSFGTWEEPLGKKKDSFQRIYQEDGQSAITHYEVLQENEMFSLIKVEIETGRSHQIRAHCAIHGHPIVGDSLYGSKIDIGNQIGLVCVALELVSPFTKKEIRINKAIPDWMAEYL